MPALRKLSVNDMNAIDATFEWVGSSEPGEAIERVWHIDKQSAVERTGDLARRDGVIGALGAGRNLEQQADLLLRAAAAGPMPDGRLVRLARNGCSAGVNCTVQATPAVGAECSCREVALRALADWSREQKLSTKSWYKLCRSLGLPERRPRARKSVHPSTIRSRRFEDRRNAS